MKWLINDKRCTLYLKKWTNRSLFFLKWFFALSLLWPLFQITTFAHFIVPTGSMLPTLLPGDRILVNKWTLCENRCPVVCLARCACYYPIPVTRKKNSMYKRNVSKALV